MKIAILAFHFPPDPAVGSVRPASWAHWLSQRHEVVVITRDMPAGHQSRPDGYRIVRTRSPAVDLVSWLQEQRVAARVREAGAARPPSPPRPQRSRPPTGAFTYRMPCLYDAWGPAAYKALRRERPEVFSIDASVRITLLDRDVPSYFQSLEHLLRYCARPPFALERLSVIRDADGRIARIRYVMPRHKAATWVGPGRGRKSTRPGATGVVDLTPFEFLDRLTDLVPPPRRHRHRYHGVFAPNHPLRPAVTALAIGNIGKRRDATNSARAGHDDEDCCGTHEKPRSHDTSRIAWAKLMARVGEEFPLECPTCGGDIRLISFITEPGPIRKILTHLGEPLEPPPISPARGPPTDWGELVQVHDDRDVFQASPDELPAIDIHSL